MFFIVMAVASGPAGPVLAGPVLTLAFKAVHAQGYVNGCGSARAADCANSSAETYNASARYTY